MTIQEKINKRLDIDQGAWHAHTTRHGSYKVYLRGRLIYLYINGIWLVDKETDPEAAYLFTPDAPAKYVTHKEITDATDPTTDIGSALRLLSSIGETHE